MNATAPAGLLGDDLSRPDTFARGVPHEMFRRLRAEAPVFWHPDSFRRRRLLGGHAVTPTSGASRSTRRRSRPERGSAMIPPFTEEQLIPQREIMLNMDPPRHTKYRRLVNMGFSPKILNAAEQHIRELARSIVDSVARRATCDFVTDVAAELPLQVIVEMLGRAARGPAPVLRVEQHDGRRRRSRVRGQPRGRAELAMMQLFAYANELADERKRCPREDLTSLLLQAEVDGERLTESQYRLLRHAARGRRQRDHPQPDRRRHAGADRASRAARRACIADPSLLPTARRGDAALGVAGDGLPAHGAARRRGPRAGDPGRRPGRHLVRLGQPRRGGVPGRRPLRRRPQAERPPRLRRSARTSASARTSPAWRSGSCSRSCCAGCPTSSWTAPVERLRSDFLNGIKHMPVRFTPE